MTNEQTSKQTDKITDNKGHLFRRPNKQTERSENRTSFTFIGGGNNTTNRKTALMRWKQQWQIRPAREKIPKPEPEFYVVAYEVDNWCSDNVGVRPKKQFLSLKLIATVTRNVPQTVSEGKCDTWKWMQDKFDYIHGLPSPTSPHVIACSSLSVAVLISKFHCSDGTQAQNLISWKSSNWLMNQFKLVKTILDWLSQVCMFVEILHQSRPVWLA